MIALALGVLGALAAGGGLCPGEARAGFGFGEPKVLKTGNEDPTHDFNVTVEGGPNGVWIAAWYTWGYEQYGGDADIFYVRSTDDGVIWGGLGTVNANARVDSGSDSAPVIRRGANGTWLSSWQSNDTLNDTKGGDPDLVYSRSVDDGVSWSSLKVLNSTAFTDEGVDGTADLETDGNGLWLAVWGSTNRLADETLDDFDIWYSRSTDDGLSWAECKPLNNNATYNYNFSFVRNSIKYDGAGRWLCVWATRDDLGGTIGDDYDILSAYSTDAGITWSDPNPVNTNAATDSGADGGYTGAPHDVSCPALVNARGFWVTAWDSNDTLNGTKGNDADILFARSSDGGVTWSAPEILNHNALTDPPGAAGGDYNPWMDVDSEGRIVCVWSTTAFSAPNYNDLNIAVARSSDEGATWSELTGLNFNQKTEIAGSDVRARLRTNHNGTWLSTWMTRQPFFGSVSGEYDLIFSRSTDIGLPPEPELTPAEVERVILGKYDVNEDGKLDVTDLVLLLF